MGRPAKDGFNKNKFITYQINKKMKIFKTNKFIIAVVVAIISVSIIPFFQSCNNENEEFIASSKNEKEMALLASKYLINTNNTFTLELNKKEALAIGISNEYYDKMINEINKTNEEIKKITKNKGKIYGLNTAYNSNNTNKNVRFKASPNETGQEIDSKFRGSITAFENSPQSRDVGVVNANYIEFKATSGCFFTAVTIQVNTGCSLEQISFLLYPFAEGSGRIYLPTNSCDCTITIMTPCSDGASVGVYWGR